MMVSTIEMRSGLSIASLNFFFKSIKEFEKILSKNEAYKNRI